MKNIIIIGTGAVASEVTMYLMDIQEVNLVGYLEYDYNVEKYYNRYHYEKPIIGNVDDYMPKENDYFVIGVANIGFRTKVIDILKSKSAHFYTLVHPSALLSKDAIVGEGCVISPQCIIGPNVVIGDFNHLTSGTMISHDCVIGNNNSFSTAIICGRVTIGNNNSFYVRSTVQPDLAIGDNCIIQAAMLVDKNLVDNSTVFYRFKEKIIAIAQDNALSH